MMRMTSCATSARLRSSSGPLACVGQAEGAGLEGLAGGGSATAKEGPGGTMLAAGGAHGPILPWLPTTRPAPGPKAHIDVPLKVPAGAELRHQHDLRRARASEATIKSGTSAERGPRQVAPTHGPASPARALGGGTRRRSRSRVAHPPTPNKACRLVPTKRTSLSLSNTSIICTIRPPPPPDTRSQTCAGWAEEGARLKDAAPTRPRAARPGPQPVAARRAPSAPAPQRRRSPQLAAISRSSFSSVFSRLSRPRCLGMTLTASASPLGARDREGAGSFRRG
jgi:hypothetical protein